MTRRQLLQTIPAFAVSTQLGSGATQKARIRSALCAYSFRTALEKKTMSYEDLIRLSADSEVDGVDLTVYWFPDKSDAFLMPLRRLAYRTAVEIYSISVRSDMCRPTAEQRENEFNQLKSWVDVAQKLGAGHIRVFGGNVPKTSTEDEAAGWVVEILKKASDYSGQRGIILGLENHGGITERAERIVDIVKRVDSPWVGVNLDSGNFRRDAYAQMELCVPYAVNVQMKTEVRGANGQLEENDWPRVMRMLSKSGYRGYAALEYESKEDASKAVPPLLRKLNEVVRAA